MPGGRPAGGRDTLTACSGRRGISPDLGRLYDRAAQESGPSRNPVVVIPGLLGTRLVGPDGEVVWGAFGGDGIKVKRPEDARLFALPMEQGTPLTELGDDVVIGGVLDRLKVKLLGVPIELNAYANILRALGVGGYRDEGLSLAGAVDYGDEHFSCFQFAYDWRRDIAEQAAELAAFLEEKRAYVREEYRERYGIEDADIKFDLVAHSMGGLLTRYYLRYGDAPLPTDGELPNVTWAGARHVDRAIIVGTPNAGAVESLHKLIYGEKIAPLLPKYSATLLGTFPAGYQLLPRPRHGFIVDENDAPLIDYLDLDMWERYGWGLLSPDIDDELETLLPDASPDERRAIARDHVAKSLARAKAFMAAVDVPARRPDDLDLHLIAGDAEDTSSLARVDSTTGELEIIDTAPGDGTVTRASALMDERFGSTWQSTLVTPIDWSSVTFIFDDHLTLTKDPAFIDNVLYRLLEEPHDRIGD